MREDIANKKKQSSKGPEFEVLAMTEEQLAKAEKARARMEALSNKLDDALTNVP